MLTMSSGTYGSNDVLSQSCPRKLQIAILSTPQLLDKRQEIMLVIQALHKLGDMGGIDLHKAPNKVMKCHLWLRREGGG